MENIEVLQKQLKDQIEALAEQRRQETLNYEHEVAERNRLAELERKERIEEYEKRTEAIREAERKNKEALDAEKREVERTRREAEQALNAQLEAKEAQEKQLEWLRLEISKQEFVEEQHRKSIANIKAQDTTASADTKTTEINVEHPLAPDNKGEAVQGTEGLTPETPLMSDHLKKILRQATRA